MTDKIFKEIEPVNPSIYKRKRSIKILCNNNKSIQGISFIMVKYP